MDSADEAGERGANASAKRGGQHAQAENNTLRRPETETANTPPNEVEKALASAGHEGPVQPNPAVGQGGDGARGAAREPAPAAAQSLQHAQPRNVEVLNDASMDSTVDTDGKAQQALQDLPPGHDHVIASTASLVDSVATPDIGLGGIDSRPGGNAPLIATEPGYEVEYLGSVEESSDWRVDERAETAQDDGVAEPAPKNGARMAHLIKIAPKK